MTRSAAPAVEPVVETAAAQSPDANFDSLVQHCNQRVYRLALRITRNHQDAEDARQETFLKAYRHLDQFEGRSRFTTWISRIAINEGLMNLRKRNDSRRVALDEIAETAIEGDALVKLRRPIEDPEVNFTRRQLRGRKVWLRSMRAGFPYVKAESANFPRCWARAGLWRSTARCSIPL